jgi:hypothetical protein
MSKTTPPDQENARLAALRMRAAETFPILQHFAYDHLPPGDVQETSRRFATLAMTIAMQFPPTAELGTALRKLLEGKDAAVRCAVMQSKIRLMEAQKQTAGKAAQTPPAN